MRSKDGTNREHRAMFPAMRIWLALLLGAPFFTLSPLASMGSSNGTVLVALGLVVSILLAEFLRSIGLSRVIPLGIVRVISAVTGIVTILLAVASVLFLIISWGTSSSNVLSGLGLERANDRIALLLKGAGIGRIGLWPLFFCALAYVPCLTAPFDVRPRREDKLAPPPGLLVASFALGLVRQPLSMASHGINTTAVLVAAAIMLLLATLFSIVALNWEERDGAASLIACFAAGTLVWNVGTRLVPMSTVPVTFVCVPLVMTSGTLLIWGLLRSRHLEEPSPEPASMLDLNLLSKRQSDCVSLLLEGLPTEEIARDLKVSPSTVRVHLSNAYKKLGVSGSSELLAAARRAQVLVPDQSSGADTSFSRESYLSLASALLFLLLFVLPVDARAGSWTIQRNLLLAFGSGLALSELLLFVQQQEDCLQRTIVRIGLITFVVAGLVTTLSVGVLTCLNPWPSLDALPLLAAGVTGLCFGGFLPWILRSAPSSSPVSKRGAPALWIAMVASLSLAQLSSLIRIILMALCLLAFAFEARTITLCDGGRTFRSKAIDWNALVVSLLLGFSCEEALRSLFLPSIVYETLPFLLVLALGSLTLVRLQKTVSSPALICGLLCLCTMARLNFAVAILVMAMALTSFLVLSLAFESSYDSKATRLLAFFGFGSVAGNVMVNTVGDLGGYPESALAFLGGSTGLLTLEGYLSGAVFLAAGVISVVMFSHAMADMKERDLRNGLREDFRTRTESYLLARGLSPLEISVLLLVADGKTSRQIAEGLNYSRGSINSARASGYEKLSVHSRAQLINCISAGIDGLSSQ